MEYCNFHACLDFIWGPGNRLHRIREVRSVVGVQHRSADLLWSVGHLDERPEGVLLRPSLRKGGSKIVTTYGYLMEPSVYPGHRDDGNELTGEELEGWATERRRTVKSFLDS